MSVGYGDHIAGRVSTLLVICTRHLSRATRRLLRLQLHRCYGGAAAAAVEDDGDKGGALWRRTILMGERCQPLDFAGAIHYDSSGRRVARPRPRPRPRSASASSLSLSLSRRSSNTNSEASASGSLYSSKEISTA